MAHKHPGGAQDWAVVEFMMASRSRRRRARTKRQKRARSAKPKLDLHAQVVLDSTASMVDAIASFAGSEEPASEIGYAMNQAVKELLEPMHVFDPIRLIEVARLAYLPWATPGTVSVAPAAGAAHLELLALTALGTHGGGAIEAGTEEDETEAGSDSGSEQAMSKYVSEAKNSFDDLFQLAQLRALALADPTDPLALIALILRGSQVWVRNTSYPDKVEATLRDLLDGDNFVRAALNSELGFDAADAIAVLESCHNLQEVKTNQRMRRMFESMQAAMDSVSDGELEPEMRDTTSAKLSAAFEPDSVSATVSIDEIISDTGITAERIRAVVERFRLDLGSATPAKVIDDFMAGNNPLRTRPIIVTDNGRIMLPHNALTANAVKENLEQHLKTSTACDTYAQHRGRLLETRTRAALERVLPGAKYRDGFEYYVPATPAEKEARVPANYTKRVEGDHLVLLDDVAVIVEDKAVALSALSLGGKTNRIRTDLTGIITKAAQQAGRLREAIEYDGGVLIEDEGWVDLTQIREIHTIAVSLDDLSSITTATAELVRAGLLEPTNIPWTVSLHDFELISELTERPAEFLLYLRRRRNPTATVMYTAADELDLFLFYFENGLWVEPDPDQLRTAFPFLPKPTPGERRRYRRQMPSLITSRTDPLDQWHYSKADNGRDMKFVPKPTMVPSPLAPLVDELQNRLVYGWLSIGATLLEAATPTQHKMARTADELLTRAVETGSPRSLTMPITTTTIPADGWLLVWATFPAGEDPATFERKMRDYIRTKKHQLSLPRGAVFLYDEPTRELIGVYFDDHIGPLSADLSARLGSLRPATALRNRLPPHAKRPARRTEPPSGKR